MDEKERLKQIPIITMLSAAGITAIISLFSEITFGVFLLRIFIASIAFYAIGTVVLILFASALKDDIKSNVEQEEGTEGESDSKDRESGDYPEDEDEEDEYEGL